MSVLPPLTFSWDGEAMRPLNPKAADRVFVVGQQYRMEPHEERSSASHRHLFAIVNEAWQNLPEHLADHFPTPEHLRKWCLVKAGFRDERSIACATAKEAERMAAFIKPMDDYAVVVVRDCIVTVYTAQSQSAAAMGKERFRASKEGVLNALAFLIGTDPTALKNNAAKAA